MINSEKASLSNPNTCKGVLPSSFFRYSPKFPPTASLGPPAHILARNHHHLGTSACPELAQYRLSGNADRVVPGTMAQQRPQTAHRVEVHGLEENRDTGRAAVAHDCMHPRRRRRACLGSMRRFAASSWYSAGSRTQRWGFVSIAKRLGTTA